MRQRQAFAQAGEQQQHQCEAERGTEAVEQALRESVLFLHIEQRHAKHGAIRGDQRQVDAKHLIEAGAGLADDHFGELYGCGNHQNERENAQIGDSQRQQQPVLKHPRRGGSQRQHERGGHAHAQRAVHFLRHAHERAQAEEFHQDHVVDQGGAE